MNYKVFGVIGRAHVHLAIEANDHACFGWGDGELVARERDAKTSTGEAEHLVALHAERSYSTMGEADSMIARLTNRKRSPRTIAYKCTCASPVSQQYLLHSQHAAGAAKATLKTTRCGASRCAFGPGAAGFPQHR